MDEIVLLFFLEGNSQDWRGMELQHKQGRKACIHGRENHKQRVKGAGQDLKLRQMGQSGMPNHWALVLRMKFNLLLM